jgi:hypothetical protein
MPAGSIADFGLPIADLAVAKRGLALPFRNPKSAIRNLDKLLS